MRDVQDWYPPGPRTDPVPKLYGMVYQLRNQQKAVAATIPPPAPTLQEIQQALQTGGAHPINITGLPGVAQQPQPSVSVTTALGNANNSANQFAYIANKNALYFSTGNNWTLIVSITQGTFEARWSGNATDTGAFYIESSRNNVASVVPYPLFRWNGTAWIAERGQFARNQANLATLTATLGANDAGLTIDVLDFGRVLSWNGTGTAYADPNDPPGRIAGYLVDPVGNGYVFCNGTNTTYLAANGSAVTVTLPDASTTKTWYMEFGNNASANTVAGPANGAGNAVELRPFFRR